MTWRLTGIAIILALVAAVGCWADDCGEHAAASADFCLLACSRSAGSSASFAVEALVCTSSGAVSDSFHVNALLCTNVQASTASLEIRSWVCPTSDATSATFEIDGRPCETETGSSPAFYLGAIPCSTSLASTVDLTLNTWTCHASDGDSAPFHVDGRRCEAAAGTSPDFYLGAIPCAESQSSTGDLALLTWACPSSSVASQPLTVDSRRCETEAGISADFRVSAFPCAQVTDVSHDFLLGSWACSYTGDNSLVFPIDTRACIEEEGSSPDFWANTFLCRSADSSSPDFPVDSITAPSVPLVSAKLLPEGSSVRVLACVTAAFGGCFYIESADRTTGIRADWSGSVPARGGMVDVMGTVSTDDNLERHIDALLIQTTGTRDIRPLGMNLKAVGGSAFQFNAGPPRRGQVGVQGGIGVNNVGLLVRIWGGFAYVDEHSFTVRDGTGYLITCIAPSGVTIDSHWSFVGVTGVSTCQNMSGSILPVIRVRDQNDIASY